MPYGLDGDQRPTTNATIPEPGDQADGADEEPCLRSADGDRCQLQQAATAQGGLLRRAHDDQCRSAREHTAFAEAEPGHDQPVAEARVRAGQFTAARSSTERAATPARKSV